ncbi:ecdysteroid-regulated 16 kDa protein [Bacillus rossius redtenbacheri]|uniref:ecdysteroid-regulated 16 kDa protein n=1 Tax=Bacillus rossius redtenbacheri TaxID=93214 RepID=UPI002FDEA039
MASGRVLASVACVLAVVLAARATQVSVCPDKGSRQLTSEEVNIVGCNKPPCKLKKKTTVELEVKFTADEDVESVRNGVYANIVGIPFPFIGVDGKPACPDIFNEDGSPAQCPLKAGSKYLYKGSFKVLDIYPRIRVDVVWALKSAKEKNLFCFRVPVRIY